MCFSDGSEKAFVCFDGNFQLTTLGTKLEIRDGVSVQDLDDKRLFVSKEPPVEVMVIQSSWSYCSLRKNRRDARSSKLPQTQKFYRGTRIRALFCQPVRGMNVL
jgi:hypothetical protein